MAAPAPRAAPVTIATLSSSRIATNSLPDKIFSLHGQRCEMICLNDSGGLGVSVQPGGIELCPWLRSHFDGDVGAIAAQNSTRSLY